MRVASLPAPPASERCKPGVEDLRVQGLVLSSSGFRM
jgi:hypothetical protein